MIVLVLIALLAFTVEGAIGFGSTVIAVSFGAHVLPIEVLLPAFVPINMLLSFTLLKRPFAWRVLLVEIVPIVAVGAATGLALAHYVHGNALLVAFGCFVMALSILQLVQSTRIWSAPLLAIGGVVHGIFGTGGPMIVYVARTKIADKTMFRSTLAVLWIALNAILISNFIVLERYPSPELMLVIAAAVIPGRLLGERLHRALDARRFERVVWIVLLFAGAALVIRSL